MDTRTFYSGTPDAVDTDWHVEVLPPSLARKLVVRDLKGHHLIAESPGSRISEGSSLEVWFKWIDGHYRGLNYTLPEAEQALEREAATEETAFRHKKEHEGQPDRRRRS